MKGPRKPAIIRRDAISYWDTSFNEVLTPNQRALCMAVSVQLASAVHILDLLNDDIEAGGASAGFFRIDAAMLLIESASLARRARHAPSSPLSGRASQRKRRSARPLNQPAQPAPAEDQKGPTK